MCSILPHTRDLNRHEKHTGSTDVANIIGKLTLSSQSPLSLGGVEVSNLISSIHTGVYMLYGRIILPNKPELCLELELVCLEFLVFAVVANGVYINFIPKYLRHLL